MSNEAAIPGLRPDIGDEVDLELHLAEKKEQHDFEAEREAKGEHNEHKYHYEISNKASRENRRYQEPIEPHMRSHEDHSSAPAHIGAGGKEAHDAATREVHHHHKFEGNNDMDDVGEITESFAEKHDEHVYFGPGAGNQGHVPAHMRSGDNTSAPRHIGEGGDVAHFNAVHPSSYHERDGDDSHYKDSKAIEDKRESERKIKDDEDAKRLGRLTQIDVDDIDVSSPVKSGMGSSSPAKSATSATMKPMLYLTWDGEEESRANVEKLKRFLRTKGYIIFEHAGDLSIAEGAVSSPDASPTVMAESPATNDTTNTAGSLESARAPVSREVSEKIKLCTVFVSCVTRKFTFNMNCKKLVLHCRKLVEQDRKKAPEMLYVMIHGTFTTESQPYHCRGGWLGYMLRDALWSPAWSHAHIAGAAEAIAGVIALRRNVIRLNPSHVLYIETRGRKGEMPPLKNH